MRIKPKKPSPAFVVAMLALILALGGTAAASIKLAASGAHAVVARARSVGPVTAAVSPIEDPLTGAMWKQGAEELQQITGRVVVTATATACTETGRDIIQIEDSDEPVEAIRPGGFGKGSPTTITFPFTVRFLFEPGTVTNHTLTVRAFNGCPTEGDFTINSASIDVVGLK